MFYSKLLPALKERGITNIMSRREWPVDVLKRVFLQLFKETPRSILAQELWCSSTSPAEWWKKTCIYNRYVHRPALQLETHIPRVVSYLLARTDRLRSLR